MVFEGVGKGLSKLSRRLADPRAAGDSRGRHRHGCCDMDEGEGAPSKYFDAMPLEACS